MHYDEDEVLTDYVWHNYYGLMSFPEKQWAKAARLRAGATEHVRQQEHLVNIFNVLTLPSFTFSEE